MGYFIHGEKSSWVVIKFGKEALGGVGRHYECVEGVVVWVYRYCEEWALDGVI